MSIVRTFVNHFPKTPILTHWNTELPDTINRTYIDQASYWLTYFPCVPIPTFVLHHTHLLFSVAFFFRLRGFLVLFDLAQIINLVWIFIKKQYVQPPSFPLHILEMNVEPNLISTFFCSLFGRTPRDIREWTQPPEFQYAVY